MSKKKTKSRPIASPARPPERYTGAMSCSHEDCASFLRMAFTSDENDPAEILGSEEGWIFVDGPDDLMDAVCPKHAHLYRSDV